MKRAKKLFQGCLVLIFFLGPFLSKGESAAAQSPDRETTVVISYIEYEWWLISWETNDILCHIYVEHEGLPTHEEVYNACGSELYRIWVNTPPCESAAKPGYDTSDCVGAYLYLASIRAKERDVIVVLPPATVWVGLDGCSPQPPTNLCPTIPDLLLIGEEPLPNEHITAIHGTYDGLPFTCDSAICELPLKPTGLKGVTVEFWADSSFGDSSERYTALVRVIDTGVPVVPGGGGWYVDVISTQWIGEPIASCAQIWEVFPPLGEPPAWLSTPDSSELLASDEPYYYLAGRLISQGLVDVSACTTGGLLTNGYADTCGLEKSAPLLTPWQNLFDDRIVDVAEDSGVPAQLMKNLFAQESQFWPGVFRVPWEFGLGQITDNGADSILFWDESFYEQFCPLVLAEDRCAEGYMHLGEREQRLLRGAVAFQANSDCAECPTGIDLKDAKFSVSLFANTLVANCAQINQTIYNATELSSGAVSTYEDLWRLTVANYHAGAGCTAFAIHSAWQAAGVVTWEVVATRFTVPCMGVVPYVDKITDTTTSLTDQ
jgi:hypothetical protein